MNTDEVYSKVEAMLDVDIKGAMERFCGNKDLFLMCLKRFAEEPTFGELKKTIQRGDYEGAFEQAHTLKGVCANMGLISLLESVSGITEILRSKSYDGLKEEFEKTEKLYSDTVNKIKELIN